MKKLDFDLVTTRGGDRGDSFTYSGEKKAKHDLVFECVGDLDELNSFLGIVRNLPTRTKWIEDIQKKIINLSSQIATEYNSTLYSQLTIIVEKDIDILEKRQRNLMKDAVIPQEFILPGQVREYTAYIDVCRSVCRRCERNIVKLIRLNNRVDLFTCQKYLNRLSDFLFVLARYEDSSIKGKRR